jgi:hypothetical protein
VPALLGYFPDPSGTRVRVVGIRAKRAKVSGPQVVVAEQLELVIVRLVWPVRSHGAAVGRVADGLPWPVTLPVSWLASPHVGVVFVSGLRMRVMPRRVLAHDYLRCWPSAAGSDYLPGPAAL